MASAQVIDIPFDRTQWFSRQSRKLLRVSGIRDKGHATTLGAVKMRNYRVAG